MVDWNVLVREHWTMVFGTAWHILGHADDAEDVAQEVFTEAEFESIDAHLAALETAHTDPTFAAANEAVSAHLVDGSLHDYVLFEA